MRSRSSRYGRRAQMAFFTTQRRSYGESIQNERSVTHADTGQNLALLFQLNLVKLANVVRHRLQVILDLIIFLKLTIYIS